MTLHEWIDLVRLFAPSLEMAAAVGVAGSIVGLFVLLRGESMMALALPQVVAIGAALSLRWELEEWRAFPPPLAVALAALAYFVLAKRRGIGSWVLPCFYVAGLCLSFILIANKGQEVSKLQTLFTGIDVAVTEQRAMIASPILIVVGLLCALLWRRWLLLAQAANAAELAGLYPARWDALFLLLLTITTLLGTDSLGVVMVLTMIFLLSAAALPWARRIPAALVVSVLMSLLFLVAGFYLSNEMNWPFSQSVGGFGFFVVIVSHGLSFVFRRV